jgi:hypothetical protein
LFKVHRRRGGYWRVYHLAHTLEVDSLVRDIVVLVKECCPSVRVRLSGRGRRPVHSWEKMVCICLLMVILGLSFRDMQNMVPRLGLPWYEPYPDHSTYIGLIIRSPWIILSLCLIGLLIYVLGRLVGGWGW